MPYESQRQLRRKLSKNISLTAEQYGFCDRVQVQVGQTPKEQQKTQPQGDLNVTFSTAPSVNALSSKLARRVSDPLQQENGLQSKWFIKQESNPNFDVALPIKQQRFSSIKEDLQASGGLGEEIAGERYDNNLHQPSTEDGAHFEGVAHGSGSFNSSSMLDKQGMLTFGNFASLV